MTDQIIGIIVLHTNEKISEKFSEREHTSSKEIKCFIGLSIIMGALGDTKQPIDFLFSLNFGKSIYRSAISRDRFKFIFNNLRFDDVKFRKPLNAFYPLEEISNILSNLFGKYWSPSECVVIDEQMVGFNGKFKYKSYQPAKPIKKGILIRSLCDAHNRYLLKFKVYTGDKEPLYDQIFNLLNTSNVIGSGRTLTTDNYYSSIDNSERIFINLNLHTVGTFRSNRQHIPNIMKSAAGRAVKSSKFLFTLPNSNLAPITLQSFIPRKNKSLLFISTRHHSNNVDSRGLSEINTFYNKTKFGIDSIDQIIANSSCKRKTKKWTVALFLYFIDMCAINSLTISKNLNFFQGKTRDFLIKLGLLLIADTIKSRPLIGLNKTIRNDINETKKLYNKLFPTEFLLENNENSNLNDISNLDRNDSIKSSKKSYCFICLESVSKSKLGNAGYQCNILKREKKEPPFRFLKFTNFFLNP